MRYHLLDTSLCHVPQTAPPPKQLTHPLLVKSLLEQHEVWRARDAALHTAHLDAFLQLFEDGGRLVVRILEVVMQHCFLAPSELRPRVLLERGVHAVEQVNRQQPAQLAV